MHFINLSRFFFVVSWKVCIFASKILLIYNLLEHMKNKLLMLAFMLFCLMVSTKANCSTYRIAGEEKTPYEQREKLYELTFNKATDWGVKEWLAFQKEDLRIATTFYISQPSVPVAYEFIQLRKSFYKKILNDNINIDAFRTATLLGAGRRALLDNTIAVYNDDELVKLCDKFVRVQNPWYNEHEKEYIEFYDKKQREEAEANGQLIAYETIVNTVGPEELQRIKEMELKKVAAGFKQAMIEGFVMPYDW